MDFLAYVAKTACEHQFDLTVNILHTLFDDEFTAVCLLVNKSQFLKEHCQFILGEQSDGGEHGDVCHRADDIVLCQIEVHVAVTTDGELLYLGSHIDILCPKLFSHNSSV